MEQKSRGRGHGRERSSRQPPENITTDSTTKTVTNEQIRRMVNGTVSIT
jgi:hypothetical protein